MGSSYETQLGGENRRFQTTVWTEIIQIGKSDKQRQGSLLGDLLQKYWKPVYCYLRRKGHDPEQSKDLTQDFFQEILLGRELVLQAERSKGKFRTFLLSALDRFLVSKHRFETARKRRPSGGLVRLDDLEPSTLPEPDAAHTPNDAFHHAWVSQLMEQVLAEVEEVCRSRGKQIHWQVFHDRVITPILDGTAAPSIPEICKKYAIKSNTQASNMIVTVKRRFQTVLIRHMQDMVDSEQEIDGEIENLMKILTK